MRDVLRNAHTEEIPAKATDPCMVRAIRDLKLGAAKIRIIVTDLSCACKDWQSGNTAGRTQEYQSKGNHNRRSHLRQ